MLIRLIVGTIAGFLKSLSLGLTVTVWVYFCAGLVVMLDEFVVVLALAMNLKRLFWFTFDMALFVVVLLRKCFNFSFLRKGIFLTKVS
jgi:hypothetical protein